MSISRKTLLTAVCMMLFGLGPAITPKAEAYNPVQKDGTLVPGPGDVVDFTGIPYASVGPGRVWSKEYSHDIDVIGTGAVAADPEQVILWDGSGGTADGRDYTPQKAVTGTEQSEIDGLGNSRDALYHSLVKDETAMAFSYDNEIYGVGISGSWTMHSLPGSGPLQIGSHTLGGAGELTRSQNSSLGLSPWAVQPNIDSRTLQGDPVPRDLDGIELWGPVPDGQPGSLGDANKYSLENDALSGFSIFNEDGTPYLVQSKVAAAVKSLLGPVPTTAFLPDQPGASGDYLLDVDAFMVSDTQLSTNTFDDCAFVCDLPFVEDQEGNSLFDSLSSPAGLESVIFSIRQVPDSNGGYYATGSEIFVLNASGSVSFLNHAGHTWDKNFAESYLTLFNYLNSAEDLFIEVGTIDINAIEAISNLEIPLIAKLPGDINCDGIVDLLDLDILGANFGMTGATFEDGDLNSDGVVDLLDLDLLGANFGVGSVGGAVPEPASAVIVLLALCSLSAASMRARLG